MSITSSRVLYRLIRSVEATRTDFLSNADRGRPVPDDVEAARLWDGLSMYETPVQARATAVRFSKVWQSLAAVNIPEDGRFHAERTTPAPGHWTVWGNPDDLVQCVRTVEPL